MHVKSINVFVNWLTVWIKEMVRERTIKVLFSNILS
jgi:hypothetical protein